MTAPRIRVERGSGYVVVICTGCPWREMAFTDAHVAQLGHDHRERVHGDARGADSFRASRERRSR